MKNKRFCIAFFVVTAWGFAPAIGHGESLLDLLGGFDQARIAASFPPENEMAAGELSKLLYRVSRINEQVIDERLAETSFEIGDALSAEGSVKSIKRVDVPAHLVEFLEFEKFYMVGVHPPDTPPTNRVIIVSTAVTGRIIADDRVQGSGLLIRPATATEPAVVAVRRLKWFPNQAASPGERLLSTHDVDLSALAELNSRTRQPLMAEDNDAFYQMLAAAADIAQEDVKVKPADVDPTSLLRDPGKFTGHWLRMQVNTVRVTKVRVENAQYQSVLGKDYFYQIDARGDLGNNAILLNRPEGEPGDPIRFENYYPISVVTPDLPDFLMDPIEQQEGTGWVTAMIDHPIAVDSFFFRLWSYQTDFMARQGLDAQFGPLIVAARFRDNQVDPKATGGVEYIGYVAAIGMVVGIIATAWWTRRNSIEDSEVRKKQQSRESADLKIPDELGE